MLNEGKQEQSLSDSHIQPKSSMETPSSSAKTKAASRTIKQLVFEGGGVKGFAYAGAIATLARLGHLQHVEHIAGASAGAMTALVLALGFSEADIQTLSAIDLRLFEDGHALKTLQAAHMLRTYGLHPGKKLREWAADLVEQKLGSPNATFADLHQKALTDHYQRPEEAFRYRDVYIIGTNLSRQCKEIFSFYTTPDMPLADALRISVSIPLFFEPVFAEKNAQGEFLKDAQGALLQSEKGDVYVDGGLADNFPIQLFDMSPDLPNPGTLGFRVDPPSEISYLRDLKQAPLNTISGFKSFGMNLLNTAMSAQNTQHELNNFRTIYINTGTIGTTQFDLSQEQKEFLLNAGQKATQTFFEENFDHPWRTQLGDTIVQDRMRQQKYERHHVYSKVESVFMAKKEQGLCCLQLIFPLPKEEWQKSRDKVIQYTQQLRKHTGVYTLQHAKIATNQQQVLTLYVHLEWLEEFEAWRQKYPTPPAQRTLPLTEQELVILQTNTPSNLPAWMMEKTKAAKLSQALFQAISVHSIEDTLACLSQGASLTTTNPYGDPPLHAAIESGRENLIKLLLDNQAPLNGVNTHGDTPLYRAAKKDTDGKIISLLLERGALVNQANKQGMTPLMMAVWHGQLAAVKLLLHHYADVSQVDKDGYTALSKANYKVQEALTRKDNIVADTYRDILLLLEKAKPAPAKTPVATKTPALKIG